MVALFSAAKIFQYGGRLCMSLTVDIKKNSLAQNKDLFIVSSKPLIDLCLVSKGLTGYFLTKVNESFLSPRIEILDFCGQTLIDVDRYINWHKHGDKNIALKDMDYNADKWIRYYATSVSFNET
jgi:hypothetical protein